MGARFKDHRTRRCGARRNAACDLEWIAVDNLDATDDRGYADPCGYGEAVEREMDASYAIAAE